jgi:excisionase family DNA binding protein
MTTIAEVPATMSIESAARKFGISRGTAYSLAKQGKFPGTLRFGRRYVVSCKVVEKLLTEGVQPGQNSAQS